MFGWPSALRSCCGNSFSVPRPRLRISLLALQSFEAGAYTLASPEAGVGYCAERNSGCERQSEGQREIHRETKRERERERERDRERERERERERWRGDDADTVTCTNS